MSARLDPVAHPWMTAESTRAVMAALTQDGGAARFVGGAVRNALLGEPVTDIDIATPLLPDDVSARLQAAGLAAIPTGVAHGTVTAVALGKPFEITTLRRDVETDGRRAVVAFSSDWAEDAARRDFTINAIYADMDGTLFDPAGGVADIAARRVRFVGDPATRIREDYLRVLRFFRFHAWYGQGPLDAAGLEAAIAAKSRLKQLSGERVQKEMLRLLAAPDPVPVLEAMDRGSILGEILPEHAPVARLDRLIGILRAHALPAEAILLMAALLASPEAARRVAADLKLSNADRDRLLEAVAPAPAVDAALTQDFARRLLYRLGAPVFRDRLLLSWAEADADPRDARRSALLQLSREWTKPRFPLDGRDALAAGIAEGPALGRALAALEDWWLAEDFRPARDALLVRLKDLAANRSD